MSPQASTNLETLILDESAAIAEQMNKIAKWANSEEDVRYECNKLIDAFLRKAGIKTKGRHEYHIGAGRLDSKYQGVLLEYKYPKGPDRIVEQVDAPGNRKVVEQLKQRFKDFEKEQKYRPERLFGVGCDGDTLVFVRYRNGRWDVDDPKPVTKYSVERLLRALVSLGAQGYSFTAGHLAGHFGADSPLAQKGIRDLYQGVTTTKSKKAKTFFSQWKVLFSEVCGYNIEGRDSKISKLGDHYSIRKVKPAELLFAVHTYYSIFMKFLAAEIISSFSPLGVSVLKRCVGAPTSAKLKQEMEGLEQGGIWSELGITNFLEGDLFAWYLPAWDNRIADVVWDIVKRLDEYDPATLSVEPAESRDLLKHLYQELFPRSVRHDLGEYYTPDWLADHVLDEIGYDGNPNKRVLDPACGSGTFLVLTINRIKKWYEEHRHECGFGETELLQKILHNVIGFDLNPLAVMASRTNYLLAIRDLVRFASSVEIPVYLCDSVLTPSEYGDLFSGGHGTARKLKTSVGEFLIPIEVSTDREIIGKYAETIESCIRNRYSTDEFLSRCTEEGLPTQQKELHRGLYSRLMQLDRDNQNGIWARIIKNAFAPIFTQRVDFVVGNPPWVNWEHLPTEYRLSMIPLYQDHYNLFPLSGKEARLGGSKIDLSVLMTYVCADCYLSAGGKLGFLITGTVFQTSAAGRGFRRFQIEGGYPLRLLSVSDFSSFNPFEGATNRTTAFVVKKGFETIWPVKWTKWALPKGFDSRGLVNADQLTSSVFRASPLRGKGDPTSALLVLPEKLSHEKVQILLRASTYRAYKGVYANPTGVYWFEVLANKNSKVLCRNVAEASRKKVDSYTLSMEKRFLYPMVRGRDISAWRCKPVLAMLMVHDPSRNTGTNESLLKTKAPLTYEYLLKQKDALLTDRVYQKFFDPQKDPFWTMFGAGRYTMREWKVVWKEQAKSVEATVVSTSPLLGQHKLIIPNHKCVFASFDKSEEAFYVAAFLNSTPFRFITSASTIPTQLSGHLLKNIYVPTFDTSNPKHRHVSELSERCHRVALEDDSSSLSGLEGEIDWATAEVWKISQSELEAIRSAWGEHERTSLENLHDKNEEE